VILHPLALRQEMAMPAFKSLPIAGYRGEQVPNEFLRQAGRTEHLAVFLPGMGYTCDMPLFYYAESLLVDAGADVLRVEYRYGRRADFRDLPEPEQLNWLLADVSAAYHAGLAQRPYRDVTLIGKSLGTLALGHLLAEDLPPFRSRAVWLTPLLREDGLREQMRRYTGPSLVAIGTADPHYDQIYLNEMPTAPGSKLEVVDDADHSLDIPGDTVASVRAVERVTQALQDFLERYPPTKSA